MNTKSLKVIETLMRENLFKLLYTLVLNLIITHKVNHKVDWAS